MKVQTIKVKKGEKNNQIVNKHHNPDESVLVYCSLPDSDVGEPGDAHGHQWPHHRGSEGGEEQPEPQAGGHQVLALHEQVIHQLQHESIY